MVGYLHICPNKLTEAWYTIWWGWCKGLSWHMPDHACQVSQVALDAMFEPSRATSRVQQCICACEWNKSIAMLGVTFTSISSSTERTPPSLSFWSELQTGQKCLNMSAHVCSLGLTEQSDYYAHLLIWLCIVAYKLVINREKGCPDRSLASASTYSRRDLSPSLLFSRLMPGLDISPRILARFSPPFLLA